jgi:hypothetical protein
MKLIKMKRYIAIVPACFILNFSFLISKAQNLVPNPDFETVITCPASINNIADCAGWKNFGNSPDYYNGCGTVGMNVPESYRGYQFAHSGTGMAGVIAWMDPNSCCSPDFREYIGIPLTSTLQIGTTYFLSFYINLSGYPVGWQQVACDKMGLRLSTVESSEMNMAPMNNSAHIWTEDVCMDTLNWMKISGSFVADSAYKYVVIGNFFDDKNTDTLSYAGPYSGSETAYYYIDDVCVTTDSLYNAMWAIGVKENAKKEVFEVFPNPASERIFIRSTEQKIHHVTIYDQLGCKIRDVEIKANNSIEISDLAEGLYFFQFISKDVTETRRILIAR